MCNWNICLHFSTISSRLLQPEHMAIMDRIRFECNHELLLLPLCPISGVQLQLCSCTRDNYLYTSNDHHPSIHWWLLVYLLYGGVAVYSNLVQNVLLIGGRLVGSSNIIAIPRWISANSSPDEVIIVDNYR